MNALYSEVIIPKMLGWRAMEASKQEKVGFASRIGMEIVVSICTLVVSSLVYSAKSNFDNSISTIEQNVKDVSSSVKSLNESVKQLTLRTQVSATRIERIERQIDEFKGIQRQNRKEFRNLRSGINESRSKQNLPVLK